MGAGDFRIRVVRGHGHQTVQADVRTPPDGLDECGDLVRRGTRLGLLARDVNLQKRIHRESQLLSLLLELIGQPERVERMQDTRVPQQNPDLVALQVADHVPARQHRGGSRIKQARLVLAKRARPVAELLDAVLTQIGHAQHAQRAQQLVAQLKAGR